MKHEVLNVEGCELDLRHPNWPLTPEQVAADHGRAAISALRRADAWRAKLLTFPPGSRFRQARRKLGRKIRRVENDAVAATIAAARAAMRVDR